MKILIISQSFWPDNVAVSQQLTDLAEELVKRNHKVHVLSSLKNYEDPLILYNKREIYEGIIIERIWQTGFGKSTKMGRLIDFACFNIILFLKLLFFKKKEYDSIIGLTSPPLVSFLGVITAKLKGSKFFYWTMDLQPELAIVSGYLKKESLSAKLLLSLSNYIFKNADSILTLDRYMADYIVQRGTIKEKIFINPMWPVVKNIYRGPKNNNPFKIKHKLNDKIVVMYSGNHSLMHPLDTLLDAILLLKNDSRFIFVFIGGGVRKNDVTEKKIRNQLTNILQLRYLERDKIHLSLSAADIHVVIHGNGCTGFTHPSKIYGAMYVGRPILYIGPEPSHITDILDVCRDNISVRHGDSKKLADELLVFADKNDNEREKIGINNQQYAIRNLNREKLIANLINEIERQNSI